MRELALDEVEEVAGGNPALVMLAYVAARAAAPYVYKAVSVYAGAALTYYLHECFG